jgi:hypothetical protein
VADLAPVLEFSYNGYEWHTKQNTSDNYYRFRFKDSDDFSQAILIPRGADGPAGESAYQVALRYNPTIGTESEWLKSLKGVDGKDGESLTFDSLTPEQKEEIKGNTGEKGEQGLAATIRIGSVETGAPGSDVLVTNTGSLTDAILNFTIPRGSAYNITYTGTASQLAEYDNAPKGVSFLASDTGYVYIKNSDNTGDWSDPIPFKGDKGDTVRFVKIDASAKSTTANSQAKATVTSRDSADGLEKSLSFQFDIPAGKSAFDIAKDLDPSITSESSWISSLKGDKGDSFTYSDFTKEQLAGLKGPKGDSFTYSDFTEEQLEGLRGPKGETGDKGEKGDTGDKGDKGDRGDKGDTPQRGVDYWTASDVSGMHYYIKSYVEDYIINGKY